MRYLRDRPRSEARSGAVVDRDVLLRMTDVMTHRGPNDRGLYTAPGIALGVRRLSIVDVDGGHQPFANEDDAFGRSRTVSSTTTTRSQELGRAGIVSGAAATPRSCRTCTRKWAADLPTGCAASSASRSGTSPHGRDARRPGPARCQAALLRRRRRPCRVRLRAEVVLASGMIDPELDHEAIDAYLTLGYVPAPRTPLADVQKLLPGHRIVIDDDGRRSRRTGSPPRPAPTRGCREVERRAAARALEEAVRVRLMSDVPARRDAERWPRLEPDRCPDGPQHVRAGKDLFGRLRGTTRATSLPTRAGRERPRHRSPRAPALDERGGRIDLAELVWALDEPLADLSALGFLALSELAARHVTVALSGQGADELLGGYPRHWRAGLVERAQVVPRPLARCGAARLRQRSLRTVRECNRGDRPGAPVSVAADTPSSIPETRAHIVRDPLRPDDSRARELVGSYGNDVRDGARAERCTSTRGSASSTTCCTTPIASRWRIHSRCASPSSITR